MYNKMHYPCEKNNCNQLLIEAREQAQVAGQLRIQYEELEAKGFEAQAEAARNNKIAESGFRRSQELYLKGAELFNCAEKYAKEAQRYAELAIKCYKNNCQCDYRRCKELECMSRAMVEKSLMYSEKSRMVKEEAAKLAGEAHEYAVIAHEFSVKSAEFFRQADELQRQAEEEAIKAAVLYEEAAKCFKGRICKC